LFLFFIVQKSLSTVSGKPRLCRQAEPPVVTGGFDYLIAPGDPVDLGDSLGLLSSAYMLYLSKES
ncbi:hypothetical protein, partial [Shouchella clausii]|uniref:hypothetical protein n=1 Tax=Shouchella clausii TaxID=79880 RepID=UPI00226D3EC2